MNILDEIITHKKKELALSIERTTIRSLEGRKLFKRKTLSMTDSILSPDKTGIIAEFKRKSPSKGMINAEVTVEEVTTGYFRSGASGLSILTDYAYFGGKESDLTRARELNPIPILRKDFIIDEYQIIEAKSLGADAVLLIAAVLSGIQVLKLARCAHSLGLQVILEIHGLEELGMLCEFVDIIGVNNRDLKTFVVDTEVSMQMAAHIPAEFVRISESGISSPLIVKQLKSAGYQGFLIGESFMRAPDPVVAFSDFVKLILFDYDQG
jgi:indole-3-glycerol phosphate synthase